MNKKLISGFLSLYLLLGQATSVAANTVQEELNQNKSYREQLESNINKQEEKVFTLNDEINSLNKLVEENNKLLAQLVENIETTELEIKNTENRIEERQKLYDSKMRQLYKNGGQADYITVLLDSDSLADFISRVKILSKLIYMDSQIITEFNEQSNLLETLLVDLDNKKTEAEILKSDNEKKLSSLEKAKQEQASYIASLEKELSELNKLIQNQEYEVAEAERREKEANKLINNPSSPSRGGYTDGDGHDKEHSGSKRSLGIFKLTAYCPCRICTGIYGKGITSTGTRATANRTIAVDPRVIPYGSSVEINGKNYIAEDSGSAIKKYKIDIFFNSHSDALRFGVRYSEVFMYD